MNIIYPKPLEPGDKIAFVSPASIIAPELVDAASHTLTVMGYEPVVMPHVKGRHGTYSGSKQERLDDMLAALSAPSVRAIMCSRGGYGAVHLLADLAPTVKASTSTDPKWLIGFSDISALHSLWASAGIVSIHGSMAKQLGMGADTLPTMRLNALLTGLRPVLSWTNRTPAANRPGAACGRLVGGNMAVLDAITATPFNHINEGDILFIEDIAEPIYKIERILYHMKLNGTLNRLGALIVGRFTEYKPDNNYQCMESMIADMVAPYSFPVAFDAPVGHIGIDNMPLLHGAQVELTVDATESTLI